MGIIAGHGSTGHTDFTEDSRISHGTENAVAGISPELISLAAEFDITFAGLLHFDENPLPIDSTAGASCAEPSTAAADIIFVKHS